MTARQKLFHFSEDPNIELFVPRPRPLNQIPGRPLDESVVWAIDEWYSPMYFFPRDCPRLLLWPIESSTEADVLEWMGEGSPRMVAYIEAGWKDRFDECELYRYALGANGFESLHDAGMYVTKTSVDPCKVNTISDLRETMGKYQVELRIIDSMQQVAHALLSSLHFSAIRMRNATEWNPPV